ncbi:oligoendopeptidase F [Bacillaceae bacterium S4-13-58]
MGTVKTRLTRQEVPEQQMWDLSDLFQSREEWQKELKMIEEVTTNVTKFKGKLGESGQTMLQCLDAYEKLVQRLTVLLTYASLKQSADSSDPVNQGDASRASDVASAVGAKLSFVESEIIGLPEETVKQFLAEEPQLQPFAKYISELQEKKVHTLSLETEEVLAALGSTFNAPYVIYNRAKLSDMSFDSFENENGDRLPNSFALYEEGYVAEPSTTTRRNAFDSFVSTLKQYKNTVAATYATQVNQEIVTSRLRKFDSVTDMLLQPQQVTKEMYHNQLDVIQKELAPHMRKYAELKKKVLGLDKVMFCDLKAPLDPEFKLETSYEEACETILDSLQIMGPEYSNMVKRAMEERWVDYSDNVGKSTGAFCSSPYGVHPYILMTWSNSMHGAFTLAHELGHAGHFYLAAENQRLTNTRPSLYFIEAPSTMNEILLGNYLFSNTKDARTKRWVILQQLGTYYHNFVTHLLEGELQRRVYSLAESGEPLTANVLSVLKGSILREFWGDTVEIDEGASLTWMRQPHYYMGLYPYTYSAGLTVSTLVSQNILEEGKPAVDRWLEVLKAGGTLRPLDLIKKAGVDMSKPDAISQAVAHVGKLVDELIESYK